MSLNRLSQFWGPLHRLSPTPGRRAIQPSFQRSFRSTGRGSLASSNPAHSDGRVALLRSSRWCIPLEPTSSAQILKSFPSAGTSTGEDVSVAHSPLEFPLGLPPAFQARVHQPTLSNKNTPGSCARRECPLERRRSSTRPGKEGRTENDPPRLLVPQGLRPTASGANSVAPAWRSARARPRSDRPTLPRLPARHLQNRTFLFCGDNFPGLRCCCSGKMSP